MSNVIFVESPAFVGFSYSNTSADAVVGASMSTQPFDHSLSTLRHHKRPHNLFRMTTRSMKGY